MGEPVRYLGLSALAERAGIRKSTAAAYGRDGYLPAPDVVIVEGSRTVRGWSEATVDAWLAARPGSGARTDLSRDT